MTLFLLEFLLFVYNLCNVKRTVFCSFTVTSVHYVIMQPAFVRLLILCRLHNTMTGATIFSNDVPRDILIVILLTVFPCRPYVFV